jgi:transposase
MELLEEGLSLNKVGRKIGAAPISVKRWRDERDKKGDEALAPKPVPGRPPKLRPGPQRRLLKILAKGAIANGYRTDLWTTARIVEVIEENFGVKYHRDHIGRFMRSLGWSWQKPKKRALERSEQAVEKWKREDWPRIKKTPKTWAPT